MLFEYLKLAYINISRRKLRSFLTILEILIGISAVISLISLSDGFSNSVQNQFNMMGANKIIIAPISTFGKINFPFTTNDVNEIKKVVGVSGVSYIITGLAKVKYKSETKNVFIGAYPLDSTRRIIETMENLKIIRGRGLKKGDNYKIVVGCDYSKKNGLFSKPLNVGDSVIIQNHKYKIVGVLSCIGDKMDDTSILTTVKTARKLLNLPNQVYVMFAQVNNKQNLNIIADNIQKKLFKTRHVNNDTKDFIVQTPKQLSHSVNSMFSVIQLIVIGIAAISLFVAIFGIMNTMYSSVTERIHEIGIMKSIGARNSNILLIFLFESGLLGLLGGIFGLFFGIALAKFVEIVIIKYTGSDLLVPAFSLNLFLSSLIISFLFGILGGILPARKASLLKPVDAIRK